MSELVSGTRFPSREELDAVVRLLSGGDRLVQQMFVRLYTAAEIDRSASRSASAQARASQVDVRRRQVLPRVADVRDWVRLGVHTPITVLSTGQDLSNEVSAGALPAYVLREADRMQLRPALKAAAESAPPPVRLVVVVGEALAGKTRTAAEATLPDWTLVVPRIPAISPL
jgi:hypothetical protein